MGGACGAYGAGKRGVQGSGGETEGKSPLGRHRHRWEDNIKIDLQEVGRGCEDWMELAQDRGTCEYGDEPSGSKNAGNFLTSCRTS